MSNAIIQHLESIFRPDLAHLPIHFDADGVLLDFASGFTQYMLDEHGIQAVTSEPENFDFSDSFPDTPGVAKNIGAFLESDHFLNISAYKEVVPGLGEVPLPVLLNFLRDKGVEQRVVSSVATNDKVHQMRLECLAREFDNVFEEITIIPLGASKKDALKQFPSGFFIDDQLSMCQDGSLAGHLSHLKTQKYNVRTCPKEMSLYGIERVQGLINLPYFQSN